MVKENTKNPSEQPPPRPPQQNLTVRRQQQQPPQQQLLPPREVRIRYINNNVVHVVRNDFKAAVQRLTGRQPPQSTASGAIQGRPTGSLAVGPSNMPSITPGFIHLPSTTTDAQGVYDGGVMTEEQPPQRQLPPLPEVRIHNRPIHGHEDDYDYEALLQGLYRNPHTPSTSTTVDDESLNFENAIASRAIQGPFPGHSNMPSITPDFSYPQPIANYSQGVHDGRVMTMEQQPPQGQLLPFREVRIDNRIIRVHQDDYEALLQKLYRKP